MKRSLLVTVFVLFLAVTQSYADTVVDTGPGPSANFTTAWGLGAWQWLAARFTVTQPTSISTIQGWMLNYSANNDQTPIIAKIYTDGGTAPGTQLYAASFTVNPQVGWYGPTGLQWTLPPGNYWVAFEAADVNKTGYWVEMPAPAQTPLANYASVNWGWNNGMQYGAQGDFLKFAVRISSGAPPVDPPPVTITNPPPPTPGPQGTSVPVMEGWWLLPGILAGVGIFARRRKEL